MRHCTLPRILDPRRTQPLQVAQEDAKKKATDDKKVSEEKTMKDSLTKQADEAARRQVGCDD